MRIDDPERLRAEILNYRPDFEAPEVREQLLETAWPRLVGTLELIPEARRDGDVLELGATPFFLTLCLRQLCRGRLALGNYFGTPDRHGTDRLTHRVTGDELRLSYDLFNIESDDFPYPDGSFDLVIFSELIEHLAVNPVRALSEMHRVLRPDGTLIVTTPNALSQARLESYLFGTDQMVDRYSPACGYGARHNREYAPHELRALLAGTGFVIETMTVRDLMPLPRLHRWHRAVWKRLLALYAAHPREEHIFLRARRTEPFRWCFPPALFDNIESFALVRYPWVEMGINDSIQCVDGWHPLEDWGERGGWVRRMRGRLGQGFLKTPERARTLGVECFVHGAAGAPPLAVRVIVWNRWLGRVDPACVYLDRVVSIEPGRWHRLELPLQAQQMHAGDEVEVRFEIPLDAPATAGVAAAAAAGRDLAVRKLWLAGGDPT